MEPLSDQFSSALTMIEIDYDRGKEAHAEVRGVLEQSEQLRDWGVDTILIGSYSRRTAIYPTKDVDVFTKLEALDTTADPGQVFKAAELVLTSYYGDRAQPQDRSIKILFDGDFSVDAVVAVHSGSRWAIRSRREFWSSDKQWQETDPEELGRLTSVCNAQPAVGSQGSYVPVVKLMRQTRRQHLGKSRPGGLYFEFLTHWAFKDGISHSTFAEIFAVALRRIANQLTSGVAVLDPATLNPYTPTPSAADLLLAANTFRGLANKGEAALMADRCRAAVLWREILGRNDRGQVFALPAGCDERGKAVSAAAAVTSRGSDEARGFA
jgi:Second Messenger Oligonucleotide or Dinucleotide Synthetase domain